jgi:hypothetical protein
MKALFISEQTLLDNSVINENVSFTQIRPTIVKVQEIADSAYRWVGLV